MLGEAGEVARQVLTRRRQDLEDLAMLLIERETVDAAKLQIVQDRHPVDLSFLPRRSTKPTIMPPPRADVPPYRVDDAR